MLIVISSNDIMLCYFAECHCAECRYAKCHYCECHYCECHYAECHYAECRYTNVIMLSVVMLCVVALCTEIAKHSVGKVSDVKMFFEQKSGRLPSSVSHSCFNKDEKGEVFSAYTC